MGGGFYHEVMRNHCFGWESGLLDILNGIVSRVLETFPGGIQENGPPYRNVHHARLSRLVHVGINLSTVF